LNFFIYSTIADTLAKGIDKGYRKGIASVVLLNKKEILRLADTPELFKISYTDVDKVALTNFKIEAFTVAGVMSYECEEKLKQLAVELQEGKHPLAKGEKDIKKIWADEAYNILADYVQMPDMPPPNYLNTNLRTAMQSSYHAAQYIRLQDESVKDLYPAYQYKTLADSRVREAHMKLHDMIWASNDPVWDKIWPPNGWNCRCYIKPLNQDEKANSNVQPITPPEKVSDIAREGRIGKDFERNPGQAMSIYGKWKDSKLKDINYELLNGQLKEYFSTNKFMETDLAIIFPPVTKLGEALAKYDGDLEKAIDDNALVEDKIEFSKENWEKLFPNNRMSTQLGELKLGENQFEKFAKADSGKRKDFLGMFYQTLNEPLFVILDKVQGKTKYIGSYIGENNTRHFIAITIDRDDLKIVISGHLEKRNQILKTIKNGELLHTRLTALDPAPPESPKQFSFDRGRFDMSNIMRLSGIDKFKTNALQVLKHPDEIWGETYNHNGVTNSEVHYIRYRVEGFELVKVNNSTPYDYSFVEYARIDEFRKGVLIQDNLALNLEATES
jgi:SPP1 gp7 family putative phage head morphogenesis protein